MSRYAVIEAPSVLGLFPSGVERLPQALLDAGLGEALEARHAGRIEPRAFNWERDQQSGIRNAAGVCDVARQLADLIEPVLAVGDHPLVLGGDCSILLGPLLALRRRGRYGLLFIDGHADFYQPEAEPNGEAASMDLALATGRGPAVVASIDGLGPLVSDDAVEHLGRRDALEAEQAGSHRIEDSDISVTDLQTMRHQGVTRSAKEAVLRLSRAELDGFWVHLDCDVLNDGIMPAVDYRLEGGGLTWEELSTLLTIAAGSPKMTGIDVTIFNPTLDPDGSIGKALVACLDSGLRSSQGR